MEKEINDARILYDEVKALYDFVVKRGKENYDNWEDYIERDDFRDSAKNLLNYLALRRRDIRELQNKLIPWGLSSLGRLESKTLPTLEAVLATLARILNLEDEEFKFHPDYKDFQEGRISLDENTRKIFGKEPDGYRTRIMVTMPEEAAKDYELVERLVDKGMNIARINCSHDDEDTWLKMINNIRKASDKLKREVKIHMDIAGPKIRVDWTYTNDRKGKVKEGDLIRLAEDTKRLSEVNDAVMVLGTTVPQIFKTLEVGHDVLIDDGTIETEVIEKDDLGVLLKVRKLNGEALRIKSEKGLNFPKTNFEIDILDDKDKKDLAFAVKYADIICFSFVRNKNDIFSIREELHRLLGDKAKDVNLMAKIETMEGVENIGEIILAGAGKNPMSIMIARGDLAVEAGYIRLAELQQEITWICEAASIPVVWATEVLASLLEKGIPARSEITDVVEGALSECIMLNKGPYVVDAVELLGDILSKVEIHQYKKTPQLRALNIARIH